MIPSWMPPTIIDALTAGATVTCFDRQGDPIEAPAGLAWATGSAGIGLGDLARVHAPDRARLIRTFRAALAEPGQVHEVELRINVDSTWTRTRLQFANLLDEPRVAALVRVQELIEVLPAFEGTTGQSTDGGEIPWVDLELDAGATITAVCGMPEELYGIGFEELIGRSALDFVHPDDLTIVTDAGLVAMRGEGDDVTVTHRIRRPNGSTVLVLATMIVEGVGVDAWKVRLRDAERVLHHELAEGMASDQLFLVYQPVVEIGSARMLGAEALVRWVHPARGFIPPDQFIPLAESSDIIVELGAWVLRTACAEAATWPEHLHVAVNLSVRQLGDKAIVPTAPKALAESGLPADRLVLEVTESALLDNADRAIGHLAALKELGVHLAIDDFGTGYSSLLYLKRMPVDLLKVDRTFVAGLGEDRGDTAIVESVVALAHALGIQVVAEGVETEAQHRYLIGLGCDTAQGYLWSRPAPADQFQALIDRPLAVSPD
jgi:EAL domain-containing protein (putative c-di-GMP-specific phosphodiesterase class I)